MNIMPICVLASRDAVLLEILEHAVTSGDASVNVQLASTLADTIARAGSSGARVAVLDMHLAPLTELQSAVRTLLAGGTRTLVLASHHYRAVAPTLLLAGASGLLYVEDAGIGAIAAAVRDVDVGDPVLHPSIVNLVLQQWRLMTARDSAKTEESSVVTKISLSAREKTVLELVGDGKTTREIARSLGLAEKTIESHRARIYAKLGARNQAHAISLAAAQGLLAPTTK